MSGTTTRMLLAEARAIAVAFCDLISEDCAQVYIAGSIRRCSPTVGDIEIVAEPVVETVNDMFGEPVGEVDLLDATLTMLLDKGVVMKRATNGMTAWGLKHKRLTWQRAPIDLFCAEERRFGLIMVIRTGPAAYSHQLVTPKGQTTRDGRPGLLPPHLRVQGGWLTWRTSGQRIETPAEQDVYQAIGLPYVAPEARR